MEFGKRIQMKRKAMKLTAAELAKMAGCSEGRITQFEAGLLPAKVNSGALARVKRILKVRVRGVSPKKAVGRARKPMGRKPGPATAPDALLKAIAGLHLAVSALSTQVARLSAKVSVPHRMLREAPAPAPVSEANGSTHPSEALAA